jgi:hypothetical protein
MEHVVAHVEPPAERTNGRPFIAEFCEGTERGVKKYVIAHQTGSHCRDATNEAEILDNCPQRVKAEARLPHLDV